MIITSLAPTHKNLENQLKAIESWKKFDTKIVSVNHISEINVLKDVYDVEFIEPKRTGAGLFGKHYVPISEILGIIRNEGSGLILNSDIILNGLPKFNTNPLIFNRYDFVDTMAKSTIFRSGFDGFYLTEEHCNLPESQLCLGQCHWDYWLPFKLIQKGFKLQSPRQPYLFHKKHSLQYNEADWKRTAQIFSLETGMRGSPQQISNKAFQYINSQITNI